MFNPWIGLSLSVPEAQQVILLRTIRFAEGGKRAEREAKRMMSEKIDAAGRAGAMIVMGASVDRLLASIEIRSARTGDVSRANRLAADQQPSGTLSISTALMSVFNRGQHHVYHR